MSQTTQFRYMHYHGTSPYVLLQYIIIDLYSSVWKPRVLLHVLYNAMQIADSKRPNRLCMPLHLNQTCYHSIIKNMHRNSQKAQQKGKPRTVFASSIMS
jgi:hypothetical protein